MPVTGMEAEFNVVLDGVEIDPRAYWGRPAAFIDQPLLTREKSSYQIPTGGAVYFDRGVIEVVTPVIELARGCTARVVRNLWSRTRSWRDQLTRWEKRTGHHVRIKGLRTHYNVSSSSRAPHRAATGTWDAARRLLANISRSPWPPCPPTAALTGSGAAQRQPHRDHRDFTPDPSLMVDSRAWSSASCAR